MKILYKKDSKGKIRQWTVEIEREPSFGIETSDGLHGGKIKDPIRKEAIPNNLYKNIDYQSEGRFYRLGIGYLAYLDEVNRLGLGMRYAESSFKDEGVIFINSETINSPMRNNFER